MNRDVTCNRCGHDFVVDKSHCAVIEEGELSVQYFSCPRCGARYHIFTTDARMRELLEERQSIQKKIAAAHANKFREKTIRGYIEAFDRTVAEQKRLMPALKKRGEEILCGGGELK